MGSREKHKPVIGIVGGVGAGKTTAAKEFAALGCALIDADEIGYELLAQGEVRKLLRERWGERIFDADRSVNRKALGEIVFDNRAELDALNAIMRPRIRRRIEEQIGQAQENKDIPAVVLDAAILFEAGWDELCSHVVFVSAPQELRKCRAGRRGWDASDWRSREKSQIPLDSKKAECYCTVDNSSSVSHLREQARRIFHRIVYQADRS